MNLGENIKNLRIKKGLTRQDLAKELNVSDSTISRYENNKREPNIEMLNKIAEILNVTTYQLMTGNSLFDGTGRLSKAFSDAIECYGNTNINDHLSELLQKDKPIFKSFEEYKEKHSLYWEDVVTWYPIDDCSGFDLNSLEDSEIEEIANFLELSFKTKISEIKNKRAKKDTFRKLLGD